MKITNKYSSEFKPYTITFTIETIEDATKLFVLFDHIYILDTLDLNLEATEVRRLIKHENEQIDYIPLWEKLDAIVKERI